MQPAGLASAFPGMIVASKAVNGAKLVLLVIGLFTVALSRGPAKALGLAQAEYYALLLFAISAMMVFSGCSNLIVAFVALETFSLAMYILAGFNRKSRPNREAALKYFLIGAFAAGFFLYGIAIFYGATGSVSLEALPGVLKGLAPDSPRLKLIFGSLALLLVGLGFKVGLAPFHLWAPDTYEGAPTPVTAFLSAGAKVAGFAMLIQVASFFPLAAPAVLFHAGRAGELLTHDPGQPRAGAEAAGIKRLLRLLQRRPQRLRLGEALAGGSASGAFRRGSTFMSWSTRS